MQINDQLQKPLIENLERELQYILEALSTLPGHKVFTLLDAAKAGLTKLRRMNNPQLPGAFSAHSRQTVRELKLEVRFLQRRLRRLQMTEKGSHDLSKALLYDVYCFPSII